MTRIVEPTYDNIRHGTDHIVWHKGCSDRRSIYYRSHRTYIPRIVCLDGINKGGIPGFVEFFVVLRPIGSGASSRAFLEALLGTA